MRGNSRTGWTPYASTSQRQRVLSKIFRLADALADDKFLATVGFDLGRGAAGIALAFHYLNLEFPGKGYDDIGFSYIQRAIEGLQDREVFEYGLYGGYSGVSWVVEHAYSDASTIDSPDDPNIDIDALLANVVTVSPWPNHFDLISGLAGVGIYALERRRSSASVPLLEGILARLEEVSDTDSTGVAWLTSTRLMSDEERSIFPDGRYDIGVAHGNSGVLGFLAAQCAAPGPSPTALRLLHDSTSWLLANGQIGVEGFSYFQSGAAIRPARTAWCYGDPGVAMVLNSVAAVTENDQLRATAAKAMYRASARAYESTEVVDASLCHGASGLAHIYGRFSQATGDDHFLRAAREWLDRTLNLSTAEEGICGYLTYMGKLGWQPTPGFLDGAAGIALGLLASVSENEPSWDRSLLLSTG